MTKRLIPMGILSIVVLMLVLTGCKNATHLGQNTPVKSAAVVLRASAVGLGLGSHDSFPVPGGSLVVDTAAVNIAEFRIQENSGPDSGGNGQCGGQGEGDQPDSSDQEHPDIVVAGPFPLQIAGGETFIDTVAIYPGTFKQLTASFGIATQPPFNGNSIVIKGTYTPSGGSGIPVILQSVYDQETECLIAGGGITVPRDTTVALDAAFDVAAWFTDVDLAQAVVTNGQILIDSSHNTDLLAAFEANLENSGGDNGRQQGEH